jgi:hypothetical protein
MRKKSWHPSSLKNVEQVWRVEQEQQRLTRTQTTYNAQVDEMREAERQARELCEITEQTRAFSQSESMLRACEGNSRESSQRKSTALKRQIKLMKTRMRSRMHKRKYAFTEQTMPDYQPLPIHRKVPNTFTWLSPNEYEKRCLSFCSVFLPHVTNSRNSRGENRHWVSTLKRQHSFSCEGCCLPGEVLKLICRLAFGPKLQLNQRHLCPVITVEYTSQRNHVYKADVYASCCGTSAGQTMLSKATAAASAPFDMAAGVEWGTAGSQLSRSNEKRRSELRRKPQPQETSNSSSGVGWCNAHLIHGPWKHPGKVAPPPHTPSPSYLSPSFPLSVFGWVSEWMGGWVGV